MLPAEVHDPGKEHGFKYAAKILISVKEMAQESFYPYLYCINVGLCIFLTFVHFFFVGFNLLKDFLFIDSVQNTKQIIKQYWLYYTKLYYTNRKSEIIS